MCKELVYSFLLRGEKVTVKDKDVEMCFPSITGDGSFFFTLKDGQSFRGENVKEVMRHVSPLLSEA